VIDVAEFLRETRIASIFARDGSGIVRLQVNPGEELQPGKLVISARARRSAITGRGGRDDGGRAAKIAFNSKYLRTCSRCWTSRRWALETTNPSSPGVLRPVARTTTSTWSCPCSSSGEVVHNPLFCRTPRAWRPQ